MNKVRTASKPWKTGTVEKDSHGSTFHQRFNETQEVRGDDGEGILHEQLQVSHNLWEIGHSQAKHNGTDLVTK